MKFLFFVVVLTATVLLSDMVESSDNKINPQTMAVTVRASRESVERLDDLSARVEELEKTVAKLQADAVQESMRRDALDRLGDARAKQLFEAQGKFNEQVINALSTASAAPAPQPLPQTIDVNVNQSMIQQQPWAAPWNNRGLLFPITY